MSKNEFFVRRDSDGDILSVRVGRIITCAVLFVLLLIIGLSCIKTVPTGYTGILTTFGRVEENTLSAGVHLIAPWQKVIKMDNRTQKVQISAQSFSSDIQQVDLKMSVNYCIDQNTAQNLYKTIGKEYYDTVLYPCILKDTKSVFAKYTAEELISHRQELSGEIQELLTSDAEKYGIQIVNFSIEDIDFTDAFTNAVEAKQVAAQNKLTAETEQARLTMEEKATAERSVIQAEADANVAKIIAEGEAEAIRIRADAEADANKKIADSITDKLIKKFYLDKWSGNLPQYYMGSSDDNNLLFTVPVDTN